MAAKDADSFVGAAVESVLCQTLADFELIVIDDASGDATRRVVEGFEDPRVRLLVNEHTLGLAASLNKGVDAARGRYIARLDADDLAAPVRLAAQTSYLDMTPEVAIVGCQATMVDVAGIPVGVLNAPIGRLAIRWELLLGSPFIHPSVMWRRASFDTHGLRYNESLTAAQDYDLWSRALTQLEGENLPERLLLYRRHEGQMTTTKREVQLATHDAVAASVISRELDGLTLGSRKTVSALRGFAIGGDAADWNTEAVCRCYLELFDVFAAVHTGEPALGALRRRVVDLAARRTLRRSRNPRILASLVRRDPLLPARAVNYAVRRIRRRLARRSF